MKFQFMHIADVHLGYTQYGLGERSNDFRDAFLWAIDEAVRERVDFVLLAGDLFHKRAIGALTLNQAFAGLKKLQENHIPCVAVEGNHELAYYDEPLGWLHFLALQGLLVLLSPDMSETPMRLSAWGNRRGSWYDVLPGVRVHGMKYMGAGVTAAIRQYAAALSDLDAGMVEYSILMAHTGVQGVLETDHSSPTAHEWRSMDNHVDYIALGHIHKPFVFDDRIYNPGSLESNSVAEYDWLGRGYLLVNVDTVNKVRPHTVASVESPKREFVRLTVKVDHVDSQDALLAECNRALRRTVRDRSPSADRKQPIVELILAGNLPFDGAALNLRQISESARESLNALHVIVKNLTSKFEVRGEGMEDGALSRPQLEQLVMTNLFASDARFSDNPTAWAAATVQVKDLAVAKAPSATIVGEIAATIARME